MKIRVDYEETDIAAVLSEILKHPNKDEIIKLLVPMICENSPAVQHFFKIIISGNKLPEVLPNGTVCRVKVDDLGYSSNQDLIREKFADQGDTVPVIITKFKGYHSYSNYEVEYANVLSDGTTEKDTCYVKFTEIEEIEEF